MLNCPENITLTLELQKKYAHSEVKPSYTLESSKSTKLDPYKSKIDLLLEEEPYSAVLIHEKLQDMGLDCGYTIVREYITIKEAAEKWGVSVRRVQTICNERMIPGVVKFGHEWAIPKDAEKPDDARIKSGKYKDWRKKIKNAGVG